MWDMHRLLSPIPTVPCAAAVIVVDGDALACIGGSGRSASQPEATSSPLLVGSGLHPRSLGVRRGAHSRYGVPQEQNGEEAGAPWGSPWSGVGDVPRSLDHGR